MNIKITPFIDDGEKMRDFFDLTKEEFLDSYSYLTEGEYDATAKLTVGRGYVCRHCSTEIIEKARSRGDFRGRIAHHFRGDKGYGATCARCGQKGICILYEIV